MKIQTSIKKLKEYYGTGDALAVGYCDAWHLLRGVNAFAYNAGVYGWNFDAFEVNGKLITTGYRGMFGRRARFVSDFEKKARAIFENWNIKHETKQKRLAKLREKWLNKEFETGE